MNGSQTHRRATRSHRRPLAVLVPVGLVLAAIPVTRTALADDVMLQDGGRVRGAIMEESPTAGVRIRLLDGTVKLVPAEQVKAVSYDHLPSSASTPNKSGIDLTRGSAPTDQADGPEPARKPRSRRERHVSTMDDPTWDDRRQFSPPRLSDEEAQEAADRARSMVISGGVLTGFGWAAALAGAVVNVFNELGNQDDGVRAAGVSLAVIGTSVGVTGSVVLGVGVSTRRQLEREKYTASPELVALPHRSGALLMLQGAW